MSVLIIQWNHLFIPMSYLPQVPTRKVLPFSLHSALYTVCKCGLMMERTEASTDRRGLRKDQLPCLLFLFPTSATEIGKSVSRKRPC
jgi:hypothetical protein